MATSLTREKIVFYPYHTSNSPDRARKGKRNTNLQDAKGTKIRSRRLATRSRTHNANDSERRREGKKTKRKIFSFLVIRQIELDDKRNTPIHVHTHFPRPKIGSPKEDGSQKPVTSQHSKKPKEDKHKNYKL